MAPQKGWISPWAFYYAEEDVFKIANPDGNAPVWILPSRDGEFALSVTAEDILATEDHSSGITRTSFVYNDYGTLISSQEYKALYGRYNLRSTTPSNPVAEVTGIEGVAASYINDEAITFRGGYFRTFINADNTSSMRTNIGCEMSARASFSGGTECVAENGTAFVGARIWMAPYFTAGSVGNINNFWGLWIYGEHATQRNADAALLISDAGGGWADGIRITSPCTSAQLEISGTAILAAGEQAIYINTPSETVATNGIWITLKSTVTSGDLSGVRSRVYGNAASAGANIRGAYLEAKMEASKYAAQLEGALLHADYSAGSITISGDVRGFTAHISQGSGLNAANLYGGLINIQTRGDETITTDDVGLMIQNEAVGGNGRLMDSAIKIAEKSMGGGVKAFGALIDATGVGLTEQAGNKVILLKFKDDTGTERLLVFDSDANTVVSVEAA